MKTVQLTFELPQDVFSVLRQEPAQFLDEMRLAAAVKWYWGKFLNQKLLSWRVFLVLNFWMR